MHQHIIDLASLKAQGRVQVKPADSVLEVRSTHSITPISFNLRGDTFKGHFLALPSKFHLPLRIDLTIMLDYPSFILFVGGGHVTFASPWQDNRRIEDVAFPSGKTASFDNNLPLGEWVDISVICHTDAMQILITCKVRIPGG